MPSKTLECSHATGAHDEPCDLVAGLTREVDALKAWIKIAEGESISARCHRTRYQCCHICESITCGDNTSPAATEVKRLRQEADGLRAQSESRLKALLEKAAEAKSEWIRAENAEGRLAELTRCLSHERCYECGQRYNVDPATGMCCMLADHVEAYAAISGKAQS